MTMRRVSVIGRSSLTDARGFFLGRVILQKLSNVTKRQEARMPTWASAGNDHSGRNSLVVHSKCFKSLAHQGNRFIERAVQPRIRHKSNAHAE
mmetsp:Transcript_15897/g.39846  ORF Transcript_15897/g.39846 Transcript_15897/m.39846 type:complete len:93 (-) Transcript_15897:336-614(-)